MITTPKMDKIHTADPALALVEPRVQKATSQFPKTERSSSERSSKFEQTCSS
jgi:hypothetical protein